MAKAANFEMEGSIIDKLPGGKFKVKLENGHEIICGISGKMRMSSIKLVEGDKVKIAMSPYDINNGYITWRL